MPMLYIVATISLILIIICLSRLDRNYKKIRDLSDRLDRLEGMLWNLSQGMGTILETIWESRWLPDYMGV